MIGTLLRLAFPLNGAATAALLMLVVITSFHAGYVGADRPDLTDRETCEHQEIEIEELNEIEEGLGPLAQECDPDNPAHERSGMILEAIQEHVVEPWYRIGELTR